MKKFFLFSFFCALFLTANAQLVSLKASELAKLKTLIAKEADVKNHWEKLLKTADEALSATPNPADTILSEGILQGDPRKIKTWKSLDDMQKIYALGLAYKVGGLQKYLDKASEFLLAWAKRNQPQGNPINDTTLDRIIFTYDLLKTDLKPEVIVTFKAWLNELAKQEIKTLAEAKANKGSTKSYNNWNSHRIKVLTQIGVVLNDKKLTDTAIHAYFTQISQNLNSDGSSFDFRERDALHYHIYDIDPLLVAATILSRHRKIDLDYYTTSLMKDVSLKKSVEWLLPYYTGEKIHAEWVNTKSAFDKKRAENGEKGYTVGTLFKPIEARTSIALAGYFDPRMIGFYQNEAKMNTKYPTWQFVLNELKNINR